MTQEYPCQCLRQAVAAPRVSLRAVHLAAPPLGRPPWSPNRRCPRIPLFPIRCGCPEPTGLFGVADAAGALTLVAKAGSSIPFFPASRRACSPTRWNTRAGRLLNPVLRVSSGAPLRIKFWNALDETSIIHWHGLKVDSNNDGHPHYAVPGGATYDYRFTVANRAGTYWYHPHPHHLTGKQVYHGLAGFFIVEDDEELALQKALDLRLGETDIPLVLQDRRFDDRGELVYAPTADERFHGHLRQRGAGQPGRRARYFDAATRIYRFRILNGSNARLYRLAFRHDEQLLDYHVIGTDGGLLDRPRTVKEAFLAPGERMDVLLDLRGAARGDAITLVSLPFDAMHMEMAGSHAAHAQHGAHGQRTTTGPMAPSSSC